MLQGPGTGDSRAMASSSSDREPATLERVAQESGLSVTTVSKILRGSYKGNTRKGKARVLEITELARRLGYTANGSARRLRDGRHRSVAVLIPVDDYGQPENITSEYVTGLAAALQAVQYGLQIHTYPRFQTDHAALLLRDRNFDGVAVLEDATTSLDAFLAASGIPAVHINTPAAPGRISLVRDEYAAARSVVSVVVGLGYRHFHVIGGTGAEGGPAGHFSYAQRGEGIRAALAATGATASFLEMPSWDPRFIPALQATCYDPGTVVLCTDSATVLRCLRSIPQLQPLACCDDCHQFMNPMNWLTRARFDRALLGRQAAGILLHLLNQPDQPLPPFVPLQATVQVGDSTPALRR